MGNACCRPAAGAATATEANKDPVHASSGQAKAFLGLLGLEIYVGAFEMCGYDTAYALQSMTVANLDQIQRQSHVPILPGHRQKILDASQHVSGQQQQQQEEQTQQQQQQQQAEQLFYSASAAACTADDAANICNEQPAAKAEAAAGHADLLHSSVEMLHSLGTSVDAQLLASLHSDNDPHSIVCSIRDHKHSSDHCVEREYVQQMQPAAVDQGFTAAASPRAGLQSSAGDAATDPTELLAAAADDQHMYSNAVNTEAANGLPQLQSFAPAHDEGMPQTGSQVQLPTSKAAWQDDAAHSITGMQDRQAHHSHSTAGQAARAGGPIASPDTAGSASTAIVSNTAAYQVATGTGSVQPVSAPAAAAPPPSPGPLIAHKAALPRTSSQQPPLPTRYPAPCSVWSYLPAEVANQSYAATVLLSGQPLPSLPAGQALMSPCKLLPATPRPMVPAAVVAAGDSRVRDSRSRSELPTEVSSQSYAATVSLSAQPSQLTALQGQQETFTQQQQQQPAAVFLPPQHGPLGQQLQRRQEQSDPGHQPDQHQQQQERPQQGSYHPVSFADATQLSLTPAALPIWQPTANAGGALRSYQHALADLPPSVQQLHETVVARLRGQQGGRSSHQQQQQAWPSLAAPQQDFSATFGSQQPTSRRLTAEQSVHRAGLQQSVLQEMSCNCMLAVGALCLSNSGGSHSNAQPLAVTRANSNRTISSAGTPCSIAQGNAGSAAAAMPSKASAVARAADVSDIVARAKQRVAARQCLPAVVGQAVQQQQQPGSVCSTPRSMQHGTATAPQQRLQPWHMPMRAEQSHFSEQQQRLPAEPSNNGFLGAASSTASIATALHDGGRAMRMLQDYRIISELDAAIQARVSELATQQQRQHSSSSNCTADSSAAAAAAAGQLQTANSVLQQRPIPSNGLKRVSSASWRPGMPPSEADTAKKAANYQQQQFPVTPTASPYKHLQQQQQWLDDSAAGALPAQAGDTLGGHFRLPGDKVAIGLLGIREALNNSYDAGQPASKVARSRSSSTPGAAAAAPISAASGAMNRGYSSSNVGNGWYSAGHAKPQQPAQPAAQTNIQPGIAAYDSSNPFLSGSPDMTSKHKARPVSAHNTDDTFCNPFVSRSNSSSIMYTGKQSGGGCDNPFLRESLGVDTAALQPQVASKPAAAGPSHQQHIQGYFSQGPDDVIGAHMPFGDRQVMQGLMTTWMAGGSAATAAVAVAATNGQESGRVPADVGQPHGSCSLSSSGGTQLSSRPAHLQGSGVAVGAAKAQHHPAAAQTVNDRIKRIVEAGRSNCSSSWHS